MGIGASAWLLLLRLAEPSADAAASTHDVRRAPPPSPAAARSSVTTRPTTSPPATTAAPTASSSTTATTSRAGAAAAAEPPAPVRLALRDPFADPARSGGARWISPDLLDPFVARHTSTPRMTADLRDPFAPLPTSHGVSPACRVRPDGLVVQRPRVLRASAPPCPPSDPALRDPFVDPAGASSPTKRGTPPATPPRVR